MCYSLLKWKRFEPTEEFLSIVREITTITKLQDFLKDTFHYQADDEGLLGDKWNTPQESLDRKGIDCDDYARFSSWVLKHILKREAYFGIFTGWYNKKCSAHALAFYRTDNGWGVFSNDRLYYIPKGSFADVGKSYYTEGLRKHEISDPDGGVLEFKWSPFRRY